MICFRLLLGKVYNLIVNGAWDKLKEKDKKKMLEDHRKAKAKWMKDMTRLGKDVYPKGMNFYALQRVAKDPKEEEINSPICWEDEFYNYTSDIFDASSLLDKLNVISL